MARKTPKLHYGIFTWNSDDPILGAVQQNFVLSSPAEFERWQQWLDSENIPSFHFKNNLGTFTARREKKQRGGEYWSAYRKAGRLHKKYLGKSADLTMERMGEIARAIEDAIRSDRMPLWK